MWSRLLQRWWRRPAHSYYCRDRGEHVFLLLERSTLQHHYTDTNSLLYFAAVKRKELMRLTAQSCSWRMRSVLQTPERRSKTPALPRPATSPDSAARPAERDTVSEEMHHSLHLHRHHSHSWILLFTHAFMSSFTLQKNEVLKSCPPVLPLLIGWKPIFNFR